MPRLCGCTVYKQREGRDPVIGNDVILYCKLHGAAQTLLDALQRAKDRLRTDAIYDELDILTNELSED